MTITHKGKKRKKEGIVRKYRNERVIRFLANVDPIDFFRATEGLCPSETLFLVCSKTFTTAETMLNARTAKKWILDYYESIIINLKNKGLKMNLK